MAGRTAHLDIDLSTLQSNWQTAKTALQQIGGLVNATQDAVGTITTTYTVGAEPGTVEFSADATLLQQALTTLRNKLGEATAALDTCDALLTAGLPVSVESVG